MTMLDEYPTQVLPHLPHEQREQFVTRYPHIRLTPEPQTTSVATLPVLMLSALTGTGKTTTLHALDALESSTLYRRDVLPTRRDIADFIVIPMAQYFAGDDIHAVTDRRRRFHYTRLFAQHIPGGIAAVYATLHCTFTDTPLISEGIRGSDEIAYSLAHSISWSILELSLDPVARLCRLSTRDDAFDRVQAGTDDLSFLPERYQGRVRELRRSGDISAAAIAIMQAEAHNYGLTPYAGTHTRYHHLAVDELSPQVIATHLLERMPHHAPH